MEPIYALHLPENGLNLKRLMMQNHFIMVYSDILSAKSHEHLMHLAEHKLDHLKTDKKSKKKILNILVETMQNTIIHSHKNEETVSSLVVIGFDEKNDFFVISGNTVSNENTEYLRGKIDQLNQLGPDELRELYKQTIQINDFSDKGGAGLGLIDIRRKSKSKLDYHFSPIDNGQTFFTLKVNIAHTTEAD